MSIPQSLRSAWVYAFGPVYVKAAEVLGNETIEHHGVELDISSDAVHPAINYRLRRGLMTYEDAERQFIDEYLQPEDSIIELGGGIGFISCYANQRLNPDSTHLSVEADDRLQASLEKNRDLNECSYTPIHAAYEPDGESVEFNRNRDFYSSSVYEKSNTRSTVTVEGVNMMDLIFEHDIDMFTLICDIEGSEGVLLEELDMLEESCSRMIIELHDNEGGKRAAEVLADSNFTLIDEGKDEEVFVYER